MSLTTILNNTFPNPTIAYILRIIVILGGIGSVFYIISSVLNVSIPGVYEANPDLWTTNEDAPKEVKDTRVTSRGTLVSIISAVLLTVISIIMVSLNVPENDIEILFGFLFAPVLGYVLDTGIGTDKGLQKFKSGMLNGINYMMESLASAKFPRFIVTFLLDMFVSKPMAAIFKGYTIHQLEKVQPSKLFGWLDEFISKNLTGIVQSIVGFITFQTYTNQTRFMWAYPGADADIINSFTIMICTSIAAAFYLVSYGTEVKYLSMNLALVMSAFLLISLLVATGNMDPTKEVEKERELEKNKKDKKGGDNNVDTDNYNTIKGYIIFFFFLFIGIIYPLIFKRGGSGGGVGGGVGTLADKITDPLTLNVLDAYKKSGTKTIPSGGYMAVPTDTSF